MLLLQIYLFLGLVLHKVIWEVLRVRAGAAEEARLSTSVSFVKVVKIGILVGILVQIWLPDVLPISNDPAIIRLCGTILFTVGLLVAIAGRVQLGDNWSNIETGRVLTKQDVVDRGLYGYIRHPIYTGDLLLLIGLELALNSWLVLGALLLCPVVMWKAIKEEEMLLQQLKGYVDYHRRTKRFIPFVM
ncbi:MAG TPA: isoprenylcysteine carboxylmethyltransferase family protein [Pyrinomonadaceae bacterium]